MISESFITSHSCSFCIAIYKYFVVHTHAIKRQVDDEHIILDFKNRKLSFKKVAQWVKNRTQIKILLKWCWTELSSSHMIFFGLCVHMPNCVCVYVCVLTQCYLIFSSRDLNKNNLIFLYHKTNICPLNSESILI